jgi:DNA invertase Pin-like site-specific DNA recombinase
MTIYAYLRISTLTHDQTNDNQRKKIVDAGFTVDEFVSEEGVSGTVMALERPAFSAMMGKTLPGDTVICTALDRLGRNAIDVLHTVDAFKERGVALRVMQLDGTDLTSSAGKILVHVMACMAEIERDNISERTKAGLARTKAEGTFLGPKLVIQPKTLRILCEGRKAGMTLDNLSGEWGIDRNTIARNTKKWENCLDEYEIEYNKRQKQYENS